MNYLVLKSIVETTLAHSGCKNCGTKAHEQNAVVVDIATTGVSLEITCPSCGQKGSVRAEFNIMNPQGQFPKADITIPFPLGKGQEALEKIKDGDILNLREKLKNSSSIQDLLS